MLFAALVTCHTPSENGYGMKTSKQAYDRRTRGAKKARYAKYIPREFRESLAIIIDYLDAASDCHVCWLSVAGLAKQLGVSKRTAKRHIAVISKLDIFFVKQFQKRADAIEYCEREHGFTPRINQRLRDQAPNLYVVNLEHDFWTGEGYRLSKCVDMGIGNQISELKKPWNKKAESHSPPRKVVSSMTPGSSVMDDTQKEKPSNDTVPPSAPAFSGHRHQSPQMQGINGGCRRHPLARSACEVTTAPPNLHYSLKTLKEENLGKLLGPTFGRPSHPADAGMTFISLSEARGDGLILDDEDQEYLEFLAEENQERLWLLHSL